MSADQPDEGATESVFRLIYRSHSLIESEERNPQLAAIFTSARSNNRSRQITGALLVTDSTFVQALEGPEADVKALYEHIRGDSRHDDVTVLTEEAAPRTFGRWAMAEVSTGGRADSRLVSNKAKGEIVAMGKDPSITPAQEEVLVYMREAASGAAAD